MGRERDGRGRCGQWGRGWQERRAIRRGRGGEHCHSSCLALALSLALSLTSWRRLCTRLPRSTFPLASLPRPFLRRASPLLPLCLCFFPSLSLSLFCSSPRCHWRRAAAAVGCLGPVPEGGVGARRPRP